MHININTAGENTPMTRRSWDKEGKKEKYTRTGGGLLTTTSTVILGLGLDCVSLPSLVNRCRPLLY